MNQISKELGLFIKSIIMVLVLLAVGVCIKNINIKIEDIGGGEDVINALNAMSNLANGLAGLIIFIMLLGAVTLILRFPPGNSVSKIDQQFISLWEKVNKVEDFYTKVAPQLEQESKAFEFLNSKITEAYHSPNKTEGYESFETEFLHELQLLDVIYKNLDERASGVILESTNELIKCLDDKSKAETNLLEAEIKSELAIFKDLNK